MSDAQKTEPAKGKVKDKRSKHQIRLDKEAEEAKRMWDLWMKYKNLILFAFSDKPITQQHEKMFLEVTGELQKQQRILLKFVPRDIDFGAESITKLMKSSVSIAHLRDLPESDKKNLYTNWHNIYIHMTRMVGAMRFIAEGYVHKVKAKAEVDIRGMKKATKGAGVPPHKNPTVITLVIVVGFVLVFLLSYLGVLTIPGM